LRGQALGLRNSEAIYQLLTGGYIGKFNKRRFNPLGGLMNEDIIEKLEAFVGELDFLLQEGAVFSQEEKATLMSLGDDILSISEELNTL